MKDKIALVTGSSKGIGRDIALRLADSVSGIAVHYKSDRQKAQEVVKEIKQKGKNLSGHKGIPLKLAREKIKTQQHNYAKVSVVVVELGNKTPSIKVFA